ncbi:hypothetical protein [Streptomyces tendae]|uniref:hypothetical protein n=1 Tax=Streptomyces tendae TaxID=1932 RepID=UPI00381D654C
MCRDEWPVVKAAVPPAAAIAVSPVLGLDVQRALRPALPVAVAVAVAVAGQGGWSVAAAHRADASRRLMATTATVNALLGLVIIAVEIAVMH